MDHPAPKLSLLSTVELIIAPSSGDAPSSKISLNVAEIDELIARLSQYRAAMAPEVPREVPERVAAGKTVQDPMWIVHKPAGGTHRLLIVRHPGLGWMLFQLPLTEADKLGQALVAAPQPETEVLPMRHERLH
jgi:hypothetical protein